MVRTRPNILITGTPGTAEQLYWRPIISIIWNSLWTTEGTGKTTTSSSAAAAAGLKHLEVGTRVKEKELHSGWDEDFECFTVDEVSSLLSYCTVYRQKAELVKINFLTGQSGWWPWGRPGRRRWDLFIIEYFVMQIPNDDMLFHRFRCGLPQLRLFPRALVRPRRSPHSRQRGALREVAEEVHYQSHTLMNRTNFK